MENAAIGQSTVQLKLLTASKATGLFCAAYATFTQFMQIVWQFQFGKLNNYETHTQYGVIWLTLGLYLAMCHNTMFCIITQKVTYS